MRSPQLSLLDQLITGIDQTLRQLHGAPGQSKRPVPRPAANLGNDISPGAASPSAMSVSTVDQRIETGRLMRVNHAGEVAAQALYQGQAMAAKDPETKAAMLEAAAEESDHLAWCETRLHELGCHTSVLNPLWFAGSFAIGYTAGLAGDAWSLGFIGETERQVVDHLDRHLNRLPHEDQHSRIILETMKQDEARHGATAMAAGGRELPNPIKRLMRLTSKVMTRSSYWV